MDTKQNENKRLLFSARDDAVRARMFDSLLAADDTPEELRKKWTFRVAVLMATFNITTEEAKALAVSLIVYDAMDPVERSRAVDHGEYVRRAMEWRAVRSRSTYSLPLRGAPPVQ